MKRIDKNQTWEMRIAGESKAYKATVPGSVYNDLISETNEKKTLLEELEKSKKSLLNNKLYDNYNYQEMIEDYLSMKKPNKLLLSNIIDKITIDENKNVDIYYKIKPIFDYEIAN